MPKLLSDVVLELATTLRKKSTFDFLRIRILQPSISRMQTGDYDAFELPGPLSETPFSLGETIEFEWSLTDSPFSDTRASKRMWGGINFNLAYSIKTHQELRYGITQKKWTENRL